MMNDSADNPTGINLRYSVDENPPPILSSMLAAQTVLLIVAGIVITPAIVLRAANMPVSMEAGVIFFALFISGAVTILQARPLWRFGAGYILLMGTSGAFIAVGVTALKLGGMSLLMTLIVASSLIQFLLSNRLSLLRRIITPLVGGTTIMLLAVTVMPIAFSQFSTTTEGQSGLEAFLVTTVTLVSILLLSFFGNRSVRLWAPLLGIMLGTVVNWFLGGVDGSRIEQAAWIGLPELTWPGFDLSFGPGFWMLMPAFIIVTIVGAIETFGDAIAAQRISHRSSKPVDYRTVQGALYADGLGNFLSGCAGTMPNTTYSTSISVVDMTGVASRRVGILSGIFMVLLAFFPKLAAFILSIPAPVVGSYLFVLILLLFMHGIRMVAEDGLSYEKGFIVGIGFWLGIGFQQKAIFYDLMPDWLAPILGNGMTSGTIVTLLLMALLSLRRGKKSTFKTALKTVSLPEIHSFVSDFGASQKWADSVTNRLQLAVEETMLALLEMRNTQSAEYSSESDQLRIDLRAMGPNKAEIEMTVVPVGSNVEALMQAARTEGLSSESQLSLRILAGIAENIRHFQFHGLDFISMTLSTNITAEQNRQLI